MEIVPIAEGLVELWLLPRRHWLRKRESRIAYVRDVRKKIASHFTKPFHMLLAGSFADVDDGAPLNVVLQPWYAAVGEIRVRAAKREAAKGTPWRLRFNAAQLREQTADHELDAAQLRAAANIDDVAMLRMLLAKIREYKPVMEDMEALIVERLAHDSTVRPAA